MEHLLFANDVANVCGLWFLLAHCSDEAAVQTSLAALRESARLTESTGSGTHPQNLLNLVSGGGGFDCVCWSGDVA
jgi:hypothetical protein